MGPGPLQDPRGGHLIRPLAPGEEDAAYAVYFDAVRNGTAPHYAPEQAIAWAPTLQMEDWWPERMMAQVWVAPGPSRLEGLISLTPAGHLDLFFVRPERRRTGLAGALYARMLAAAPDRDLTTFASRLAEPFLVRRGWTVVAREVVQREEVALDRAAMVLERRVRIV